MDLKNLRKKIDKIDKKILELLNERALIAQEISKVKKSKKLEIFQSGRQEQILKTLKKINKGPLIPDSLEHIFREIFSACLSLQSPLKVAYLGPQGTFTHQAAVKKFGKSVEYVPCESILEVFSTVWSDSHALGVVPIENSIEGVVTHTLDMFIDSDLKICAEIHLKISLCILLNPQTKNLSSVKKVYSHPQVFAQAKGWLDKHLSRRVFLSCSSTSRAAQLCKREKNSACIGSSILANIYGLKILSKDIQEYLHNITRFLVISRMDAKPTGSDKTSILFSLKDKPGALYESLKPFRKRNINLTKIESRPSRRRPWEYFFFVDFLGHRQDKKVERSLKELESQVLFLKILGSYPQDNV